MAEGEHFNEKASPERLKLPKTSAPTAGGEVGVAGISGAEVAVGSTGAFVGTSVAGAAATAGGASTTAGAAGATTVTLTMIGCGATGAAVGAALQADKINKRNPKISFFMSVLLYINSMGNAPLFHCPIWPIFGHRYSKLMTNISIAPGAWQV